MHWRRLVKNIGWASQNIGGKGDKKVINVLAFLNYWGPGLPLPKSTSMTTCKPIPTAQLTD